MDPPPIIQLKIRDDTDPAQYVDCTSLKLGSDAD